MIVMIVFYVFFGVERVVFILGFNLSFY